MSRLYDLRLPIRYDSLKPATTYPAVVGAVLIYLRDQEGMVQVELARALGLAGSTMSRIESGLSALTVEQLADAAKALGTSPGEILRLADAVVIAAEERGVRVQAKRFGDDGPFYEGLAPLRAAELRTLIQLCCEPNE